VYGLYAKENVFIGASYSYNVQRYTDSYTGQDVRMTTVNTNFSIGKYFDNYRLHMNLQSTNNIGLGGDYLINLKDSKITPYIGTSLYYYYYSKKYSGNSHTYYSNNNYTNKSTTVGLYAGLTYPINKHFEFDTNLYTGFSMVSRLSDVLYRGFSIGINYLF